MFARRHLHARLARLAGELPRLGDRVLEPAQLVH